MYGSYSKNTEVNYITVEQQNPNFTAWKIMDLTDLTWDDLDNISWDEMNSTWALPFLPNTINDDALITWHGTDRVEFYQNLIKQDAILKSKGDINAFTWKNIGDDTTWEDVDHLYWDELSSTFTKFYITELQDISVFGVNVKSANGIPLEDISFNRNVAIDNVYVDFIDQVYDLDETTYPVLSSFLYEYRPIVEFGATTIHQIVAVSKAFETPNRFYFGGTACILSEYNTPLNGFGAIGDSSAGFDIYTTSNIQSGATGGATASIDIDGMSYNIPNNIITLSSLADDLNTNSPFQDWEFNIVQSYQGGTATQDEKILAYAKFYQSGEINTITYSNVYGTKYARSITTNATWNSLDVLYYQRDVKPYTQIYFNYDISNMPGFKNPSWIISKVGTGEVVFTWLNKYMVYLFTEVGEYDISLQLEDTNSNTKTITKNGLIKVI